MGLRVFQCLGNLLDFFCIGLSEGTVVGLERIVFGANAPFFIVSLVDLVVRSSEDEDEGFRNCLFAVGNFEVNGSLKVGLGLRLVVFSVARVSVLVGGGTVELILF